MFQEGISHGTAQPGRLRVFLAAARLLVEQHGPRHSTRIGQRNRTAQWPGPDGRIGSSPQRGAPSWGTPAAGRAPPPAGNRGGGGGRGYSRPPPCRARCGFNTRAGFHRAMWRACGLWYISFATSQLEARGSRGRARLQRIRI